jgi:type IV secretion system protein VirD4
VVAKNVSASDFCIRDLMNHEFPVSLYIVTQPNDKARLQPLVRVLINMIVRLLADKMEFETVHPKKTSWPWFLRRFNSGSAPQPYVRTKKTYTHRLLGMIDEFPSLGKLDILQESLAFVAGYGIKFYLICQDINQLKSRERGYGPDETITSNCHIQNAYPPNRIETAEHLSKLTGQTTIIKEHITTSGRRTSMVLGQVSRAIQEVQRPLLTADECLRMPGPKKNSEGQIEEAGDMVVYMAGFPAVYGKQPLYFKDAIFTARAAVPPPSVSDTLRQSLSTNEEIRL